MPYAVVLGGFAPGAANPPVQSTTGGSDMKFPQQSTVVAYAALFIALGGTAVAVTKPAPSPTVTACYSKRTGALRILLTGRCRRSERKIAWNKQGVPGTVNTTDFFTKAQSDARYLPLGGVAVDAGQLGGQPPSAYLTSTATAANANELGGQPPSAYLTSTGTAANASKLGGQSPSSFASSSLFGSPAPAGSAGSSSDSSCILGEVKLMAGESSASNWTLANGSLVPINTNTALFSLLGTNYGGNGTSNFALPNLSGAQPKGAGPAGVNYYICTSGIFP